MKEFKNILVLYDFEMDAEKTIRRGVNLAARNKAELTVLSVIENENNEMDILDERRKILQDLCSWIPVEDDKLRLIVKQGNKTDEALSCIERFDIDLVITPTQMIQEGEVIVGIESTSQILKNTDCPIWGVRSGSVPFYKTVLVCVDEGNEGGVASQVNKRLLELGNSLAEMEMAELKVLYVCGHDIDTQKNLSSVLPGEARQTINEEKALANLQKLVSDVLNDPSKAKLLVKRGDVEETTMNFMEKTSADILISDNLPTRDLADVMMANCGS